METDLTLLVCMSAVQQYCSKGAADQSICVGSAPHGDLNFFFSLNWAPSCLSTPTPTSNAPQETTSSALECRLFPKTMCRVRLGSVLRLQSLLGGALCWRTLSPTTYFGMNYKANTLNAQLLFESNFKNE